MYLLLILGWAKNPNFLHQTRIFDHPRGPNPKKNYILTYISTYLLSVFFTNMLQQAKKGQARYAASIGPDILHFYEDYFDLQYPLPKMDMAAIPDFTDGAMENWGLITYEEWLLLFDDELSGATDKEDITDVMAHELAHQWFGNVVTMKWWNDLWLNEGII